MPKEYSFHLVAAATLVAVGLAIVDSNATTVADAISTPNATYVAADPAAEFASLPAPAAQTEVRDATTQKLEAPRRHHRRATVLRLKPHRIERFEIGPASAPDRSS